MYVILPVISRGPATTGLRKATNGAVPEFSLTCIRRIALVHENSAPAGAIENLRCDSRAPALPPLPEPLPGNP